MFMDQNTVFLIQKYSPNLSIDLIESNKKYFADIDKLILKLICKFMGPRVAKMTLKNKA